MKHAVLISCLVVMILVSSAIACTDRGCSCDVFKPHECCSRYCRAGQCINYGDSSNDVGCNPCLKKACDRGECCSLHEVQCVRAPCPPIAQCGPC